MKYFLSFVSLSVLAVSFQAHAAAREVYATCSGQDQNGRHMSVVIFADDTAVWDTLVRVQGSPELHYKTDYDSADVYERYDSDDNGGLSIFFGFDDPKASAEVNVKATGSKALLDCTRKMDDPNS